MLNKIAESSQVSVETALAVATLSLIIGCGVFIYLIYRQIKATETIIFKDDDDASTDNH